MPAKKKKKQATPKKKPKRAAPGQGDMFSKAIVKYTAAREGDATLRKEKTRRRKKTRLSSSDLLDIWSDGRKKPSRALVKRESTTPASQQDIPPSRALVKRQESGLTTIRNPAPPTEAQIRKALGDGYGAAMGAPPAAVVDDLVKQAKRRRKPQQVTQLIARFVPGSPAAKFDEVKGHWIIPKAIPREALEQCSPEQIAWAKACLASARKAKRIKRGGRRWRAVTRDYLASL